MVIVPEAEAEVVAATKTNALKALSAAALSLPGMLPTAHAAIPHEGPEIDFQYGHYSESDHRVSVDVYQGSALLPIAEAAELSTNWVVDTWSGATPVLTMPASVAQVTSGASGITGVNGTITANNNDPVIQVLTGASPGETRYGVDLSGSYHFQDITLHATGGRSEEPDYLSHAYNVGIDWELNQKLTTVSFAFGQDFDQINPSTRSLQEERNNYHFQFGLSQVLDKNSLLRLGLSYSDNEGYLSNPYKKVYIQNLPANSVLENGGFTNVFYENRPNSRHQGSVSLGYIRYISTLESSLHLDYRFYNDSWNINSHTFETSWYQPLGSGWMLIPRIRYYSQTQADFYQLFFTAPRADNFYTSDFRLAGFGTLSGGLRISKDILINNELSESLRFEVGFEYTEHAAGLQLGNNNASNLTDFNYYVVSASIRFRF